MSEPAARRPGPRIDVDVPAHLIDVAEELFAREGIDAVSLRSVARKAGVAPAAVPYHFVSKAALVAAVVNRREPAVGQGVRAGLLRLIEHPEGKTVRDLVEAVQLPFVRLINSDPVGGLHWMKIFSQLALLDDPLFLQSVAAQANLGALFSQAREVVLPNADAGVRRRIGLAFYSMFTALAGADMIRLGRPLGDDGRLDPEFVEEMARFAAGGISLGDQPDRGAGQLVARRVIDVTP